MKKTLLISVLGVCFSASVFAQTYLTKEQVPAKVLAAFNKQFPNQEANMWPPKHGANYHPSVLERGGSKNGAPANSGVWLWTKDRYGYHASFTDKVNNTKTVEIDEQGNWLATSWDVPRKNIPTAVTYITSQAEFGQWDIVKTQQATMPNHADIYLVSYHKGKYTITTFSTADGTVLKKEQVETE